LGGFDVKNKPKQCSHNVQTIKNHLFFKGTFHGILSFALDDLAFHAWLTLDHLRLDTQASFGLDTEFALDGAKFALDGTKFSLGTELALNLFLHTK